MLLNYLCITKEILLLISWRYNFTSTSSIQPLGRLIVPQSNGYKCNTVLLSKEKYILIFNNTSPQGLGVGGQHFLISNKIFFFCR